MVPSKRTCRRLFTGVKRLRYGPRKLFPPVALDPRNRLDLLDFPGLRATRATGMGVAIPGDRKGNNPRENPCDEDHGDSDGHAVDAGTARSASYLGSR